MKEEIINNSGERLPLVEKPVSLTTRAAYALGHVFNDLAAAMWFSYTLIFLQRVALLQPLVAGSLLLLGQVVDALMTPVFGLLVDRYSKKKAWHVAGSVMVALSFPLIFGSFTRNVYGGLTMFVYVSSIVIFQTGWAAVQISHLSMIPSLTSSTLLRAELTALRYSAQVGAAVIVFLVTWIVLPNSGVTAARLTPFDRFKFRNIVVVLTLFGVVSSILFHAFLNARLLEHYSSSSNKNQPAKQLASNPNTVEAAATNSGEGPRLLASTAENNNNNSSTITAPIRITRQSWIGTSLLARVAMLYVASRLFISLATVYLPLYIEEINLGGRQALATVPLVSYTSSFVTALMLKHINRSCGSKVCYLLGSITGIIAAILIEWTSGNLTILYIVAILIGASSSITLVTALSITAEIIGPRTERSAMVYSIVTFLDKIVTGLVVIGIERWRCFDKSLCPNYNRDTLAAVCASSMAIGIITLVMVIRCIKN